MDSFLKYMYKFTYPFRKMEEEIIVLMLICEDEENAEKRRRRCDLRRLRDSSDPFQLPEAEFTKNFRLSRVLARQLIADLQPHDAQRTSLPLTVRVLATLHFFGHGSYQKCVGNNCNLPMSQPSISRSLRYIAQLIVKVKSAEISFPNSAEEENATKIGYNNNNPLRVNELYKLICLLIYFTVN